MTAVAAKGKVAPLPSDAAGILRVSAWHTTEPGETAQC